MLSDMMGIMWQQDRGELQIMSLEDSGQSIFGVAVYLMCHLCNVDVLPMPIKDVSVEA